MTPVHSRPRLDVVVRQEITSTRLTTFQSHLMRTPSAYGLRDPRHGTARHDVPFIVPWYVSRRGCA